MKPLVSGPLVVGLVRHFRVDLPIPPEVTSDETAEWLRAYDGAPVRVPRVPPAVGEWDLCWSSDLPRAEKTARVLYPREVRTTPLLREIAMAPYKQDSKPRPMWYWLVRSRLAYLLRRPSQPESQSSVSQRARDFLDLISASGASRVLAVTHGGFLLTLEKELRRRGYRGRRVLHPFNGRLYVFHKKP